jgi:small subunit ribosomal protein S16
MVMIRLARQGGTNDPVFMVVVTPKTNKRDGAFLARLGQYQPRAKTAKDKLKLDMDAYKAWLAKGAKPSETVRLLVKAASK